MLSSVIFPSCSFLLTPFSSFRNTCEDITMSCILCVCVCIISFNVTVKRRGSMFWLLEGRPHASAVLY